MRHRRAVASLLLVTVPLAGCYSTRPVRTAPAPGTTLLLDLTDAARVALGDRIGAGAARVQGQFQSMSDSGYVVRVASVRYLNGQQNEWSGEQIAIPTQFVAQAREQHFSRARTFALVAGAAAAVIVAVIKADLIGGWSGGDPTERNPGGTGSS